MRLFGRRPKRPEPPDVEAPGWDAITAAMNTVHGDSEPIHKGLVPGMALGSPLQGVSAYAEADHWHLVTYGLTELFTKQWDDVPEISGLGYELTMRVPRTGESPPLWPFDLLAKVAETAWAGTDFCVGHRLQVGGPITGESGCALEAVAFVSDPSLPTWTKSPHGSFEFYELVGVTPAELAEMQASSTAAVVERLADGNPLLITDPSRS